MIEKRYVIKNHFFNQFQKRAKNHCARIKHKNISDKIAGIMKNLNNLDDLFYYNKTYFLPVRLSRNGEKLFYILIKDNKEYIALISIYTEDMFLAKYGNKIKH